MTTKPTLTAAPATDAEIRAMVEHGLYDPANEKDACGVGFVAHIKGQRSHSIVEKSLAMLVLPCHLKQRVSSLLIVTIQ